MRDFPSIIRKEEPIDCIDLQGSIDYNEAAIKKSKENVGLVRKLITEMTKMIRWNDSKLTK